MKGPLEVTSDTVVHKQASSEKVDSEVEDAVKRISEQNINIPRNTSSKVKLSVLNIPPDTAIRNEENTKEMTANVSDSMKQTSEQKSSEIKSAKSTTAEVETGTPNKHDDNFLVTADAETNDTDTAKDTHANEVITDIVTNDADAAKDKPAKEIPPDTVTNDTVTTKNTPSSVSNKLKRTCKQKGSKTKSVKSITSEVEAETQKKHQDNLEVTPDTVTNDTDTAKDTHSKVSNKLKRTSKEKSSKTKPIKSTTSEVEVGTPKKHQDNLEVAQDTMTNDADTSKDTPTNELPPDTVTNYTDTVKDTPANEVTPDTVTNDTDTAKDTPINVLNVLKRTSKQKSSKTKSIKSTTSKIEAGTPSKHQDNLEVTPDTVTNDTGTAKDTPSNVSNKLKRTSKQKGSKTKSVKSTTSEVETGTPKKHDDNIEIAPDTVTNDIDTTKDTPTNVSNNLKQTCKQKSSKTKSAKSTKSGVEPKEHQENLEVTSDTVTKDTPANVSDNIKRTSKKRISRTKSTESTTLEVVRGTPRKNQDTVEPTAVSVTKDIDTTKNKLATVSDHLKLTFKKNSSMSKSAENTTPEVVSGRPNKNQSNLEETLDKNTSKVNNVKDTPATISIDIKLSSEQNIKNNKYEGNTTTNAAEGIANTGQDTKATPENFVNKAKTGSNNYVRETETNVNSESENFFECDKSTCKHFGKTTYDPVLTASNIKCLCATKRQENLKVAPNTVINNEIEAQSEPDRITIDSLEATSDVHKQASSEKVDDKTGDSAKNTPLNISDSAKHASEPKDKNNVETTSQVVSPVPVNLPFDATTNNPDTTKEMTVNISDSIKRISKRKSSETKSAENTTPEVVAGKPNEHQDSPEITSNTAKNYTDTAKDTSANISDSLKRTFNEKTNKSKSAKCATSEVEAGTPNKNQDNCEETPDIDTNIAEIAKDKPATVLDNIKQTSEQKSRTNKYDINTPNAAAGITSIQDTEVTPENVINNAKRDSNEYVREKETSLKTESDNVVECDKSTCKHFGKIIYDPAITTPVFDSNTECPCAIKRQENLKVGPNTITNNEIETQREPYLKIMDSLEATSHVIVHKQVSSEKVDTKIGDTAKNTLINISDSAKLTSESKDKNNTKSTPKFISRIPVKLPPDFTIENPDTTKERTSNIPDNIKRISKLKSSETESAGNTTPGVIAGKSNEHQDSSEVTSDTVKNDTDTAKDKSKNYLDSLKQISKQEQESKKTKSAENTTPEVVGGAPNKPQDSPELTSDLVTNKSGTAKVILANDSDYLERTFKQTSSKAKYAENTTLKMVAGVPAVAAKTDTNGTKKSNLKSNLKNEKSYKPASDTLIDSDQTTSKNIRHKNEDIEKNKYGNNSDLVHNTEKISSKAESSTKHTSEDTEKPLSAHVDYKAQESTKVTSKTLESSGNQSSDEINSEKGNVVKTTSDSLVECDNTTRKCSKCFCSDIYGKVESSSKTMCKKVRSIGFVFDSKVKRDDGSGEDVGRKRKNATKPIPIYIASSEHSRRDVYGKNAWESSDAVSVTALSCKLSCKSIDNVINLKVKPGTVPNIVKLNRSRFNLRGKNSVKSSSDNKIIRTSTVKTNKTNTKKNADKIEDAIKSRSLERYSKISTSTKLGAVEDTTKTAINDSAIKSENDNSPLTAKINDILTAVNSKESMSKRVSWPLTKPPTSIDNSSQMTPPLTMSNGTDVNIEEKPMKSLKYCSRFCPPVKKRKKDQQATKVENRSKTTHDKGSASTKPKSNIDGKMQDTVRTSTDLTANNECECVTITTTGVVDNVSHKEKNNNENVVKDTHDVTDRLKSEPLLLRQKSNLYYCLKPKTGICEDVEYVSGNDKKYGKLNTPRTMRVRFKCTYAKNDVKNKYEPIASTLNTAANNERGTIYYRVKRKSKAEVNSATTMDDIEEIVSTEQRR